MSTNHDRQRQALALVNEIGERLSCLTEEAFWWEDGKFEYDPQVSDAAIFQLTESLRWLRMAVEDGVKY